MSNLQLFYRFNGFLHNSLTFLILPFFFLWKYWLKFSSPFLSLLYSLFPLRLGLFCTDCPYTDDTELSHSPEGVSAPLQSQQPNSVAAPVPVAAAAECQCSFRIHAKWIHCERLEYSDSFCCRAHWDLVAPRTRVRALRGLVSCPQCLNKHECAAVRAVLMEVMGLKVYWGLRWGLLTVVSRSLILGEKHNHSFKSETAACRSSSLALCLLYNLCFHSNKTHVPVC